MNTLFRLPNDSFEIPKEFQDNQIIEELVIISDVDGVIRQSVGERANPGVAAVFSELLEKNNNMNLAFISGTPAVSSPHLEQWKNANLALDKVFENLFSKQIEEQRVAIYGVLGSHLLQAEGVVRVVDQFSLKESFEISKLLIEAFLQQCMHEGNSYQVECAITLNRELKPIKLLDHKQALDITAQEFDAIILKIRNKLDANFKLLNRGGLVETHTTNPPWRTDHSYNWLKEQIERAPLISKLDPEQKNMATGLANSMDHAFNFLMVSKTHKGATTRKFLAKIRNRLKNPLIVTIGDTQVDYPMHQFAHIAFHVGTKKVWEDQALPNCVLVTDEKGNDSQHVLGTLKVLNSLQYALNKPFQEGFENLLSPKGARLSSTNSILS